MRLHAKCRTCCEWDDPGREGRHYMVTPPTDTGLHKCCFCGASTTENMAQILVSPGVSLVCEDAP